MNLGTLSDVLIDRIVQLLTCCDTLPHGHSPTEKKRARLEALARFYDFPPGLSIEANHLHLDESITIIGENVSDSDAERIRILIE